MKIVVLAGGTSTERDVSIVSGTGICNGLRAKGHQAVLVDVFCGVETVDWTDPFPQEYDVEAASAYIKSFNPHIEQLKKARKDFLGQMCWNCAERQILFSLDFTEQMVRMEEYRQLLTLWESNIQEPDISAAPWQWTKA